MTNPNFDWIMLLPESERQNALAKRDAGKESFFKGFPVRPDSFEAKQDAAELRQAGIEGRAAFNRAIAIVDARKETERLLNAATDHIAGTLEQPADPRAWDHLLIYCPREALERRMAALAPADERWKMKARFINCQVCQTEGRILTNDGGPDDVDHGVCPECNGERVVEIETQPCGYLTECPSCRQMFENGGQCAAPVMRGGCPMGGDV